MKTGREAAFLGKTASVGTGGILVSVVSIVLTCSLCVDSFAQGPTFGGPAPASSSFNPITTSPSIPPGVPVPNAATPNPPIGSPALGQPAPPQPAGIAPPPQARSAAIAPHQINQIDSLAKTPHRPVASRVGGSAADRRIALDRLRSVSDPQHPFAGYLEVPSDPQSSIRGKALPVARLLDGVRSPETRRQLLRSYWELTGLLVEYNMRFDAERRAAHWFKDADKTNDQARKNYLRGTFHYLQPKRQVTEIAFSKAQYRLAEQIKYAKGVTLAEEDFPIPCEFPIFKKYETYSDKIARTGRSRSLGRLIPTQEQLVGYRRNGFIASENLLIEAMKNPGQFQTLVTQLQQRTESFVELADAIIEYNKMIADYATDTIGPEIDTQRLIGALIELPKQNSDRPGEGAPPRQLANPPGPHLSALPLEDMPIDTLSSMPGVPSSPDRAPIAATPQPRYAENVVGYGFSEPGRDLPATVQDSTASMPMPPKRVSNEIPVNLFGENASSVPSQLQGATDHPIRGAGLPLPDRKNALREFESSPPAPAAIQPVSHLEEREPVPNRPAVSASERPQDPGSNAPGGPEVPERPGGSTEPLPPAPPTSESRPATPMDPFPPTGPRTE